MFNKENIKTTVIGIVILAGVAGLFLKIIDGTTFLQILGSCTAAGFVLASDGKKE